MARGDLLKQLFESYQNRDDKRFRAAAEEIIEEERKKHHSVLSNELQRILANGSLAMEPASGGEPVPMDRERSWANSGLSVERADPCGFCNSVYHTHSRGFSESQ